MTLSGVASVGDEGVGIGRDASDASEDVTVRACQTLPASIPEQAGRTHRLTLRIFSLPPLASLSTSLDVTLFSAARTTPLLVGFPSSAFFSLSVVVVVAAAADAEVEVDGVASVMVTSSATLPPMTADVVSPFSACAACPNLPTSAERDGRAHLCQFGGFGLAGSEDANNAASVLFRSVVSFERTTSLEQQRRTLTLSMAYSTCARAW